MVPEQKKTILSGCAPSGNLTIGNYIGAINNWKDLQEEYNCYYMVADLHVLTVRQEPKDLRERALSFIAQYIACGLDPDKNILFLQSHVSEHAELSWILSCNTSIGALGRMTQFKDKSQKNPKDINAGLYTYPILMASDILLYQADVVPVGEDQKQHLELTRDLAQTFNFRYGETFKIPEPYIGKVGARIMSLQEPTKKMSKSDENPANYLSIIDPPNVLQKKIKSAVTDSGSEVKYDEERKGLANLLTIYSVLSGMSYDQIEEKFRSKMYGHLKMDLADLVCDKLKPVLEKYHDLMKNKDFLNKVMKDGSLRAKEKARKTLEKVYKKVGLVLL